MLLWTTQGDGEEKYKDEKNWLGCVCTIVFILVLSVVMWFGCQAGVKLYHMVTG